MSAVVLAHRPRSRSSAAAGRRANAPTWTTEGSSALASLAGEPWQASAGQPADPVEIRPLEGRPLVRGALVTPLPAARPTAAPPSRALRLTRRGRLAVTLSATAVTVLASVTIMPMVAAGVAAAFAATPVSTTTVVVEPDQSLWEVAESAVPGGDTASMVAEIADANGIANAAELRPGQRLIVPVG